MTAANDNALVRAVTTRIVPAGIAVMWTGSILFAFAAAAGLFR